MLDKTNHKEGSDTSPYKVEHYNNDIMTNEQKERKLMIEFPVKEHYYNILHEMKTKYNLSWFDMLCREKIKQYQQEKVLEEQMNKIQ